jgi:hypothetical protein
MQSFKEYKEINDMKEFFNVRTNNHINAVKDICQKITDEFPGEFPDLMKQVKDHDSSKFHEPEYTPYLHITWRYRMKNLFKEEYKVPQEIEDQMHEASEHHVKHNKHHAEYWDPNSSINKEDRDTAPDRLVDGTKMDKTSIAEMCADWMAVGKEHGNTAKSWADKNIGTRWLFTEEQEKLIYNILKIEEKI